MSFNYNLSLISNDSKKLKSSIIENKDLYIDEEHNKICNYYKKFTEIKKKLIMKNKVIEINYNDDGHKYTPYKNYDEFMLRRDNAKNNGINDEDIRLKFNLETYKYNIKYNEYNKKFINKICDKIDEDNLKEFINEQNEFIKNLSLREIYNLKYYTYTGDVFLNSYINNTFDPSKIKTNIVSPELGYTSLPASKICFFFYQFLDYFIINNIYDSNEVPINNDIDFIEFIKNNYKNFNKDIYDFVFQSYIKELKDLFKKAPKTKSNIILYRGISENYILNNSKRGYYETTQFTSTTLFAEIAYSFSKNNILIKIIVDIGLPLIFLEGITFCKGEFEVILPINSTLYIDYAIKEINYYKNKKDIICPENNNIVKVSNIIYCDYKK